MIAAGEIVYEHGTAPCSGAGLALSSEELDAGLDERIAPLVFDDEGKAEIERILIPLVETEFEQEKIREVLSRSDEVEDWRVGEAIADAYLTDHRGCNFPWPDGRDERKSGSSLPGADLAGFRTDEKGDCFAFGEVKTSSDANHPPAAMYGRTGLKKQLEDLRDREGIRHDLLKYLGHRAQGANWRSQFEGASRRYLRNTADVHLYGVLIRDVKPHGDDLRTRVRNLAKDCPSGMRIELLALYLPAGKISGIGSALVAQRTGRDT